jgi:hypothetical protein
VVHIQIIKHSRTYNNGICIRIYSVLEEFAVIMYDQSSSTNKVNDASLDIFARKQRPYNGIPPSRAALVEHIKRYVMQAGPSISGPHSNHQAQPHL